VRIDKAISKNSHKEIRSNYETAPTAQAKYKGQFSSTCVRIQMYFWKGYDHGKKVDLSKGHWNPKRKMWVTRHFSEIMKLP